MDIKALELFLSLANTLHFGHTAKAMNMSPSAVSRAIKRLETDVNETLFFRDNRHVELTYAGDLYRSFAEHTLMHWQQLQDTLQQQGESPTGTVPLFCSVTASYVVLSKLLPIMRERFPRIECDVHTGDQADAIARVISGNEQVGITVKPAKLPEEVAFMPLMTSPLKLIVPHQDKAIAEALREITPTTDWLGLPMVVSETGEARTQLDRWFSLAARKPNIYAQVSGHEAIVSLVSLGFGVGLVPELVIDSSPMKSSVRVYPAPLSVSDLTIGVVVKRRQLQQPLMKAFWSCCQQLAGI